jgi:fatty-acyl-CoA synthase
MVAGAAPPAAIIEGMHHIGIQVNHVYGLTETYGLCIMCISSSWSDLSIQQAQLHSRQGVPYPLQDGMRVLDAETCNLCLMTARLWEKLCSVATLL